MRSEQTLRKLFVVFLTKEAFAFKFSISNPKVFVYNSNTFYEYQPGASFKAEKAMQVKRSPFSRLFLNLGLSCIIFYREIIFTAFPTEVVFIF